MTSCCDEIVSLVTELKLPCVKPKWCDLTDAGPGVGISIFEVKFRDVELCRIFKSDYRIHVHRFRGDSGQREAERTNSAIGDSVVDGESINWERWKKFEGLSEDELKSLGVIEFEEIEKVRMMKNTWYVAGLLLERIDGPLFSVKGSRPFCQRRKRIISFLTGSTCFCFMQLKHHKQKVLFQVLHILKRL